MTQRRTFPTAFDYVLLVVIIACAIGIGLMYRDVQAQPPPQRVVRFGAATVAGSESVVPGLAWCTETLQPGAPIGNPAVVQCAGPPINPAATCTATGPANWAGNKANAGSVTLPAIAANTTYGLECRWPDDTSITTRWANPTTNTNGSPLTDLDRVVFAFRQTAGTITSACQPPTRCETVRPPVSPQTFNNFALGSWRIVSWAVNSGGTFSDPTAEITKVNLAAETIARDVTITVSAKPSVITELSAE